MFRLTLSGHLTQADKSRSDYHPIPLFEPDGADFASGLGFRG